MKKCNVCKKNITKKSPGLECSRCEILVHASTTCAGLTNKQLTALRAADTLEWVCTECHHISPRKSFIVPEADEDEESLDLNLGPAPAIDIKKLLQDVHKEINKIITRELQNIVKSVQYCSDKMDEFKICMDASTQKIKDLEKKQISLKNHNTNLETKIAALEQRVQIIEQDQLSQHIEVAGIPYIENENVLQLIEKIPLLINTSPDEIKAVRRLPTRRDKKGVVQVELKDGAARARWLSNARTVAISTLDLIPDYKDPSEKLYIREALTSYNKRLLGMAKKTLHGVYKYVWCKNGNILARKAENEKVIRIRSDDDIESLIAEQ